MAGALSATSVQLLLWVCLLITFYSGGVTSRSRSLSQMKLKPVKQRRQHLPSVRHRHRTLARHPPSSLSPLLRNAGRRSRSPQRNTTVKHRCQQLLCRHLPRFRVNLPFPPAGPQNPSPPQFVPLKAFSSFPLPPNQAKAMPSLYPRQDETKTPTSPKRLFLLRRASPRLLGNVLRAKTPPDLLLLLLWCAAPYRTSPLTTRLCAGWPLRRLRFPLPSTNGPEAGLGRPACLLLPVTPSERKMMRRRASRG